MRIRRRVLPLISAELGSSLILGARDTANQRTIDPTDRLSLTQDALESPFT
jgi:hypothetical protein